MIWGSSVIAHLPFDSQSTLQNKIYILSLDQFVTHSNYNLVAPPTPLHLCHNKAFYLNGKCSGNLYYPYTAGEKKAISSNIVLGSPTQVSMSFFLKMTVPVSSNHHIVDEQPYQYFIYIGAFSPNEVRLELCQIRISTNHAPVDKVWTGFAMTADTSTISNTKAYSLNLEEASSFSTYTSLTSNSPVCPANTPLEFRFYEDFQIKHLAIYKSPLTESEVLLLYQQPTVKQWKQMFAYFPLEQNSLSSLINLIDPVLSLSIASLQNQARLNSEPEFYADPLSMSNYLISSPNQFYFSIQEACTGIQLIPDDGTLDTPISTPAFGFGGWFYFPSQAPSQLYLFSSVASNGDSFINIATINGELIINGDYAVRQTHQVGGGLAGVWMNVVFQSDTGSPSYLYLNVVQALSFNLVDPGQSSSKNLQLGKLNECFFGKVKSVLILYSGLVSTQVYFESHQEVTGVTGMYFDFRIMYQAQLGSSPARFAVSDSEGYLTPQSFYPFNLNGFATLQSPFYLQCPLNAEQQQGCSLALQIWFTHSNGQAQFLLISSSSNSFNPFTQVAQFTLNPGYIATYDNSGNTELMFTHPFSSSHWHYFMFFIPDIPTFTLKYYGVSPHTLWSFPETCSSVYNLQFMRLSATISSISLRGIRLWNKPSAQSPDYFLDFSTRKHSEHGLLYHLVFSPDCNIIDLAPSYFDKNKFNYINNLAGCNADYSGSSVQNTLSFCFYDSYNLPPCRDFSPIIALPNDNIGISVKPNLASLTSYSVEFWLFFKNTGSQFQLLSATSNSFYEMKVISTDQTISTAQFQHLGTSQNYIQVLSTMKWHHLALNFDGSTASILYNGLVASAFNSQGPQDTIGQFKLCGGTTVRADFCSMLQFRLWQYLRSADQIAATMHRKLKSSETGELFLYFHLDASQSIVNNLLLNRGATQREVSVATAQFKVVTEGYKQPLPFPPLCEADQIYFSKDGRCKLLNSLSERESLRYMYIQEIHSRHQRILFSSPNELNDPASQDWSLSFWINFLVLRRVNIDKTHLAIQSLVSDKQARFGSTQHSQHRIQFFTVWSSGLEGQVIAHPVVEQTWYFNTLSHDPATDDFTFTLLSNSNYNALNIPALNTIADSGLKLWLKTWNTPSNPLAIANIAFYKEMIPSISDLVAFTQTTKLLRYYSMRDKYLFDELGPAGNQQFMESALEWRLFSFLDPYDSLSTILYPPSTSNVQTFYNPTYNMAAVSELSYALNIPASQSFALNVSPSLSSEHFAFGFLICLHLKVASLSSSLQIKLPDLFRFTFSSSSSILLISTSLKSPFGVLSLNQWNSVVGFFHFLKQESGTYLNSVLASQSLTNIQTNSIYPFTVSGSPQILIATSAASSLSLRNIYVTNRIYNLKQIGKNPATLPNPSAPSIKVFFLFTKLDSQLTQLNTGLTTPLGASSFIQDYGAPYQLCEYPKKASSETGEHCVESGEGLLFSGGEFTISDLGVVIPGTISGQMFWKFCDASTINTCNTNILGLHPNYQISLNFGFTVQVNGSAVISYSFNAHQWYHIGFVYDEYNQIHNTLIHYTRHSPSVFPNIASHFLELKLGAACGATSLKFLKLYQYIYSTGLIALIGNEHFYLSNQIAYFEFSEYGSPFVTEIISGNEYQLDSLKNWGDQVRASPPICKTNQVYSKSQCRTAHQSLKLDSVENISLRAISFSPTIFTLNLWISFDPSGLLASPYSFLNAWDFEISVDLNRFVWVKEGALDLLTAAQNFQLAVGEWHFVTFNHRVSKLNSTTYFSKDSAVIESKESYTPNVSPSSNTLQLKGGGPGAQFYISHLSLFNSFLPNGMLKTYKFNNLQFLLYNYRSVQVYYFNQLTDSNQVIDWYSGEYIALHSSFALHSFGVPQQCEFDQYYNHESQICQTKERHISFQELILPLAQIAAPYQVDQSFTFIFWMLQNDDQSECTALMGLTKFSSLGLLTTFQDSGQVVKFTNTDSFVFTWTRVSIALKLHNLYSIHIKGDAVEAEGSGSDLNELEMTPITLRGTLYRTMFRQIVLYNYFLPSSVQATNYGNLYGFPEQALRYSLAQNSGRILFESSDHNQQVDYTLSVNSYQWIPSLRSEIDSANYKYIQYLCVPLESAPCSGGFELCDTPPNLYLNFNTQSCDAQCPSDYQANYLNICEPIGAAYIEPTTPPITQPPTQPTTTADPNFAQMSKNQVEAMKTTVEASIDTALYGGLAMNLFFKGGGQYLWSLINGLQFFPFLLVLDVNFPQNCDIVLRGFQLANFDTIQHFIQSPISSNYISEDYNVAPINQKFNDHEMSSRVLFRLYEPKLLFIGGLIVLTPVLISIAVTLRALKCKRCASQIKRCYGVDFFLTLLIEEYLQLSVFSISCLDKMRFQDSIWTALSLYEALTSFYLVSFLLLICYLLLRFTSNPKVFKAKQHFFLFDGIKVVKGNLEEVDNNSQSLPTSFSRFFFTLFLLRRLGFAAVIVFLRHHTKIQLGILILLSAFQILFLCLCKPLKQRCRSILQVFDELVFIAILVILYVLRFTEQSQHSETYGLAIIWMLASVLFIKLIVLIIAIIKSISCKCKRKPKPSKIKPSTFVSELTFTETKDNFISNEHNVSQISISPVEKEGMKRPPNLNYEQELDQSYLKIANKGRRVII